MIRAHPDRPTTPRALRASSDQSGHRPASAQPKSILPNPLHQPLTARLRHILCAAHTQQVGSAFPFLAVPAVCFRGSCFPLVWACGMYLTAQCTTAARPNARCSLFVVAHARKFFTLNVAQCSQGPFGVSHDFFSPSLTSSPFPPFANYSLDSSVCPSAQNSSSQPLNPPSAALI